jgi:selenocysteine lyase/cysteine desulfurase
MINAESPDRVAFQMNTSDALNLVATGLSWRTGDRVLLNDAEFPANLHPFLNIRRHGVELDMLRVHDGVVTPEIVANALKQETRLLALSAVQFLSGYRADLHAIGALCRSKGVIFVVDGIQAVGAVPIDVQDLRIDALAAGAQKWQMAPQGTGFLYVSEALQDRIRQQYVGWLSVASPFEFRALDQPLARSGRRYEGGTLNVPGIYAMHESLTVLLEFGMDAVAGQILGLTQILIDRFSDIPGVRVITPSAPSLRAGIVTIQPPAGAKSEDVAEQLKREGILISLREGLLRFSPHFYNSAAEMERTAESVRRTLV